MTTVPVELRQQRTAALWEGLRRVYFSEPDLEDKIVDGSQRRPLRRTPRYPVDFLLPGPVLLVETPDDSDDAPSGPAVLVVPPTHVSKTDFEDPYDDGSSNGEVVNDGSALHG
jgi:hypothetical protein